MPQYRLFTLDRAGHFSDVHEIFCVNDAEALLHASKMVNSHGVEVWQRGRLLTRIQADQPSAPAETESVPEPAAAA